MKNLLKFAIFSVAIFGLFTGAMAQKTIYRCGSSYSQVPCEGAVSVDAQDARTRADKAEADKATERDMKQATAMEKARIKEEKDALAQAKLANKASEKSAVKAQDKTETVDLEKKKSAKPKKKEPEFFTAKAGPEKKKD